MIQPVKSLLTSEVRKQTNALKELNLVGVKTEEVLNNIASVFSTKKGLGFDKLFQLPGVK
jgi:hypothetical protein